MPYTGRYEIRDEVTSTEMRYRDALEEIVCLLEPLGYPRGGSEGEVWETGEALTVAMNVLAGLDVHAHRGPALRPGEPKPDGYDEEREARRARRREAWRARGFAEDVHEGKTIWRRGTAF
jgi:hypothetical protein